MPNAEDQDEQAVVFDLADKPVVTHAVLPKFLQVRTLKGLANRAGVVQLGQSFRKKLHDAPRMLRVEFTQLPVGLDR